MAISIYCQFVHLTFWWLTENEETAARCLSASQGRYGRKETEAASVCFSFKWRSEFWSIIIVNVWETRQRDNIQRQNECSVCLWWSYLKVKGRLFITAPSKAGWSQQAVDPVGDPTVKDEVSLNNPTLSIIDKDFSLFKEDTIRSKGDPSSSFLCLCCTYDIIRPSTEEREWWTLQSPSWVHVDQSFSVNLQREKTWVNKQKVNKQSLFDSRKPQSIFWNDLRSF